MLNKPLEEYPEYQQRVIAEYYALEQKYKDLQAFIKTEKFFKEVSLDEQKRMTRQYHAMYEYMSILGERIHYFE